MWVFDDEAVGLRKEPFVSGIPEIIEDLLAEEEIDGEDGFYLTFSATPFPGHQRELTRLEEDGGGNWYETVDADGNPLEGWLCPALFKYYDNAPDKLYAKVEQRAEDDQIKPDEPEPGGAPVFGNLFSGLKEFSNFLRQTGFPDTHKSEAK